MKTEISTVKYIDAISKGEADAQKEAKEFQNADAKLHVQSALLETKKALAVANRELAETVKANPYNLQAEVDALIKVEDLTTTLDLATKISEARF